MRLESLSADELEAYEERAAIREFCGNQDRKSAELCARVEVMAMRAPAIEAKRRMKTYFGVT